jgi:O-antigen biosynthesis protein
MSEADPAISIVLPTFNRASMVGRSIRSALGQTRGDFEILVVDDASTDDTEAAVAAIGDSRIRYLRHARNAGACAARNTGIGEARGDYIAFLDSDDEWAPEKLELQVEALERSDLPGAGIVTCGELGLRPDGGETTWLPKRRGWVFEDLLRQRTIGCRTSSLIVRREVLDRHEIRFDPQLPARQDWDFVTTVARVSPLEIVRQPLVIVNHHDGERVWTPARAVQAGEYLHEKFLADLTPRARSHSRFHLRIAVSCIAAGNRTEARRHVREAISADPLDPMAYVAFAVSLLDDQAKFPVFYRAGMKVMRTAFT